MKQTLLILMAVALVGCETTSWVSDPVSWNNLIIEKAIRKELKKPTGELSKADLEKVTRLKIVGGLSQYVEENGTVRNVLLAHYWEKLPQLRELYFFGTGLSPAQLQELKKALPKCAIYGP